MKYAFKVGQDVQLKTFDDYTSRELSPWIKLVVDKIHDGFHPGDLRVNMHAKEKPELVIINVPMTDLQLPMGYEDVYTIVALNVEKAKTIWSWLETRKGIACWISEDLSAAGRRMFSPATTPDGEQVTEDHKFRPHWSMGLIECVTLPERIKIEIEEVRTTKPKPEEKKDWTYDKYHQDWYRRTRWNP